MMIDSLYTDKVQLLNEALNTATKMAVIADSLQALSNKAEAYKRLYKVNYRIGNTKNALDFAIKYNLLLFFFGSQISTLPLL